MANLRIFLSCLVLFGITAGLPAQAEDSPPSRVGRISLADGAVSARSGNGDWVDSGLNDPVAAGMSVRTGGRGRAVLRVGAESIALSPGTELDLAELDDSGTQIVLRQGRIGVRLSQFDPARSIEVDLTRGGVWLQTPGDYDIAAGDDRSPAKVAAFEGRARFVGKGADSAVASGSAMVLSGDNPVVATIDSGNSDDFVGWWGPIGKAESDSPSLRHVPAELTGYEALDANGRWETVAGRGAVWFPSNQPEDWAPYRQGHWRWLARWGWTWIDDQPWGFATSHYGRWARLALPGSAEERWGWLPGSSETHPVFAPAVVAFLGTAGVGLSSPDGPAVAWFPLAPGEVYWPSYTGDIEAIRRLNAGAVANAAAIGPGANGEPPANVVVGDYQNRRFATAVPRTLFLAGKPVAGAVLDLPRRRLENAPLLAGSPQIAPSSPATRVAAVASAVIAANPRIEGAVRALARILSPRHGAHAAVVPPQLAAIKARATAMRSMIAVRVAGRAQPVTAVAAGPKGAKAPLRLAAARRGSVH